MTFIEVLCGRGLRGFGGDRGDGMGGEKGVHRTDGGRLEGTIGARFGDGDDAAHANGRGPAAGKAGIRVARRLYHQRIERVSGMAARGAPHFCSLKTK
ncbi:hypothetical protein CCACVL1_21565 [Corchorus capsularis]|uniref:Uncharacterized protein n=1 Tax=Corchorus capsularis TaxID=210143 RepID=A0A1R3H4L7_COCAP|nr:hypothetical protein CCACVL1_21565 [Corchorus capsularis]